MLLGKGSETNSKVMLSQVELCAEEFVRPENKEDELLFKFPDLDPSHKPDNEQLIIQTHLVCNKK